MLSPWPPRKWRRLAVTRLETEEDFKREGPTRRLPGRLPSNLQDLICGYSIPPQDRFAAATLLRLPRIQAVCLLELRHSLGSVGPVEALDHLLRSLPRERLDKLEDDDFAMDSAESVEILDWWKRSGLELRYTKRAVEAASGRGRLDLLQWW
ncbi:hypothetical protein DFJ73DRAFT_962708 [Zopfochytrium polystomum]|nr:hypothetical protein DFJ73DRAFT_962708 [Zopfochytrium polystomum]